MYTIALVGRPNAGKSTLFNRLSRSHEAIISEVAGTTRDVKRAEVPIGDRVVQILDTGGLEERDELFSRVRRHAIEAAKEADAIVFLVDGQMLPDDQDRRLFFELQAINPTILLALNKIDNEKLAEHIYEYMSFGANDLIALSCAHKRGLDKLEGWIESVSAPREPIVIDEAVDPEAFLADFDESGEKLEEEEKVACPLFQEGGAIRVAIIGRPNVGKSSLLNALVGHERSVVSAQAGTTIDPVDEAITIDEQPFLFVDTAGIRRRSRIAGIEKFAFDRTEKMLEKAEVALITLDCSEPFTELDERIAGLVDKHRLAAVFVLNKYDLAREGYKTLESEVRRRFRFLEHAPLITVSALSKKRIHKVVDLITAVHANYHRRLPTAKLNNLLQEATARHKIPALKGKAVRIYYATQYGVAPPRVALVSNRPEGLHFSYLRYLANRIREVIDLSGSPLILTPRPRRQEEEQ
jgi:GTP-binding protein